MKRWFKEWADTFARTALGITMILVAIHLAVPDNINVRSVARIDPGDATHSRCVSDCGDGKSVWKPPTQMQQAECWCNDGDHVWYEQVW